MKTVIEMAREAGWAHCDTYSNGWLKTMERFAELVRADEREACAKYLNDQDTAITDKLAAEIRARGQA